MQWLLTGNLNQFNSWTGWIWTIMCTRVCQSYLCPIGIFFACQGCLRWQCIWSTVVTGHQPVVCTKGQEETQCRYRPKNPPSQGCNSHPHDSSPNTSFTLPFLLSFQPLGQRLLSPSLVPTAALCPGRALKKTVCLYQPLPGMLRAGGERNSSNSGGQGGWGEVILRRLSLSNYQWVCCAFIKKTRRARIGLCVLQCGQQLSAFMTARYFWGRCNSWRATLKMN